MYFTIILFMKMWSSYCLILSMISISICTNIDARSVSNKHGLYNTDNMISSSELEAKLLEQSSFKGKQSKWTSFTKIKSFPSDEDNEVTATTMKPSEPINDNLIDKRKGTKSKWWSQIETFEKPPSKQNTKNVERNNSGFGDQPVNATRDTPPNIQKISTNRKNDTSTLSEELNRRTKTMTLINDLNRQWTSIKQTQRTITSVSMQELKNLDSKLIKTYKQCMKKRLYFYGGMLYRTRDFVVNLYRDAVEERKILEAAAKQVDKVLKQTMEDNYINSLDTMNADQSLKSDTQQNSTGNQEGEKDEVINDLSNGSKSINKRRTSPIESVQQESYSHNQTSTESSVVQQAEIKLEPLPVCKTQKAPKKKAKEVPKTKTIYIRDVKLRRQLDHAQALIDRIHRSSEELSSVVEDIIFLFRLDGRSRNWEKRNRSRPAYDNDRRNRGKLFKSPLKIFMEKYGNILQAPKKQDLKSSHSSDRYKQRQLAANNCTLNNDVASCHPGPMDITITSITSDFSSKNNSIVPPSSSPLTLLPSYNTGPVVDTSDILNSTSTLDNDIEFGESSESTSSLMEISNNNNSNNNADALLKTDKKLSNSILYHFDMDSSGLR